MDRQHSVRNQRRLNYHVALHLFQTPTFQTVLAMIAGLTQLLDFAVIGFTGSMHLEWLLYIWNANAPLLDQHNAPGDKTMPELRYLQTIVVLVKSRAISSATPHFCIEL